MLHLHSNDHLENYLSVYVRVIFTSARMTYSSVRIILQILILVTIAYAARCINYSEPLVYILKSALHIRWILIRNEKNKKYIERWSAIRLKIFMYTHILPLNARMPRTASKHSIYSFILLFMALCGLCVYAVRSQCVQFSICVHWFWYWMNVNGFSSFLNLLFLFRFVTTIHRNCDERKRDTLDASMHRFQSRSTVFHWSLWSLDTGHCSLNHSTPTKSKVLQSSVYVIIIPNDSILYALCMPGQKYFVFSEVSSLHRNCTSSPVSTNWKEISSCSIRGLYQTRIPGKRT